MRGSPQTRLLHEHYPGLLTTSQVAAAIGRPKVTVERWRRSDILHPTLKVMSGKVPVYLFDAAALRQARFLSKSLKPGPKATKETA